jgi:glyoxylate carboligase
MFVKRCLARQVRRYPASSPCCWCECAGSQEVQDIAARALWLLVKDERSCLAAEGNLLGCDAAKLAAVLAELVEVADAEEVSALHWCLKTHC